MSDTLSACVARLNTTRAPDVWLYCNQHGYVRNLGNHPTLMDAVRAEALHVKTASGGGS